MIKEIWLKAQILIIGSLSFVIALAWNDAFQNLFERVPYLKKNGPWVYAVLITLMGILIIYMLQRKK